jgi:glucokinase
MKAPAGPGGPVLGLDVGGTKIAALLVDDDDAVLVRLERPTDRSDLGEQIIAAASDAMAAAGDAAAPLAVGIGAPGQVDGTAGLLRLGVNVGAGEVPIRAMVRRRLGLPCFVEHDARAAVLWIVGSSREPSLAYMSVGTGISAAVILDGRLVRGARGLAGEIGHVMAVEDGPLCACGLRGCLEAVAGGPAVARMARDALARGERSTLGGDAIDGKAIYAAAAAGDPLARAIAERVGRHLAHAVRALVLSYGVPRVVVGGGMSRAGEPFLRPILDELEHEQAASPLVRQAFTPNPVELLPPDSDAGAWGAVTVARAGLRAAPT